jgi:site-specific DNA-methyltransferase (adenine-specific)|tara:strand:+ start:4601 stop:5536 length:936 start_codon:yes stop_codon:yes gene_type:complete
MEFNKIITADSLEHLKTLDENVFDSCVTDPPYHLQSIVKRFTKGPAAKHGKDGSFNRLSKGFMGQEWDGGDIAFQKELWEQVYRTMKPGAVLLAFSATRNYHKMATAIEDSGFEIFDMITWMYGSGFPKRKNYLKPAQEPIVMARKGVNKLNIDDCRTNNGRYPANVIHDGSDEVNEAFDKFGKDKGAKAPVKKQSGSFHFYEHEYKQRGDDGVSFKNDTGNASRFFYCAKASKKEKNGTDHPTVKPLELMKYLVRLVTPKDGLVLDPFAGTGTTGEAAILEDRKYYLIEKTEKYIPVINKRLNKHNKFFI